MKKVLILYFLIFGFGQHLFATKYALIIAIGDYPAETRWSKISSEQDIPLIKAALIKQSFKEKDITIIQDAQATKEGIQNAIQALLAKVKEGDIVMIHYSGHGQQILDDNNDESDGLDESIVPYNAQVDTRGGYAGENHFRDDAMEQALAAFRNKLGTKGQLFVLLDSCHSGSMTRGAAKTRGGAAPLVPEGWKPPVNTSRGADKAEKGSGLFQSTIKLNANAAPFIMISGASANELNYEFEGKGSLSYAFSYVMNNLGKNYTYRKLFADIRAKMQVIAPRQNPVIEGDIDYKLFNNEYSHQIPYFEVKKVTDPQTLILSSGKLSNLFEGTTVLIMPQSTEKDASKALAKGTIKHADYTESEVILDKSLENKGSADLWVYVDVPTYEDMNIKVAFENSVSDANIRNGVEQFLKDRHLGSVISDAANANLIIGKEKGEFTFKTPTDAVSMENTYATRGGKSETELEKITQRIFNFAQGQYLKNLDLKNPNYEFSFRFIPTNADPETYQITAPDQILKVVPGQDEMYLEITNKSRFNLYISIVEINSQGEVAAIFPNNDCKLSDQDRLIKAGESFVVKSCKYEFGEPYERLTLKGFASPFPLNLQTTVDNHGEKASSRGTTNPLEGFLQQSYTQSRGAKATNSSSGVDGYSSEFVYEIVRGK